MSPNAKLFWGAVYLAIAVAFVVLLARNVRVLVIVDGGSTAPASPLLERGSFKRMNFLRSESPAAWVNKKAVASRDGRAALGVASRAQSISRAGADANAARPFVVPGGESNRRLDGTAHAAGPRLNSTAHV